MQIEPKKAVYIDYTLTNDAGDVLDSSEGQAPLAYLQGFSNIVPGLENALEGKKVGDELEVQVEAKDAYGDYSVELVQIVPRSAFQGVDKIEAGMQFHASAPDGGVQVVVVREVDDENVTVDGNHPLAGQRLNFKVKVMDVRDATEEELSHGHIHGEGGHQH